MTHIRILLADDHTLVRTGLCTLLERCEGFEVIAEASNGDQAFEFAQTLRPDLLLTDISMPGLSGLDLVVKLRQAGSSLRIIVLSIHASEEYVCQAIRVGADGYLLKDADAAELERAVRFVAAGNTYLTPTVSQHLVADYLKNLAAAETVDPLTPRQKEILKLVAEGRSTKEIANLLEISIKTVESHRGQLMERLGIHDIPGLVRYAMRTGLVPMLA